jgi:hypothetical protein
MACGIKTNTLLNGVTKVPFNTEVYLNKLNFDNSLLNIVDTNVIYEEHNRRYNVLSRLDDHVETSFYGAYRFYPNGYFNYYTLDRSRSGLLVSNDLNPEFDGQRGVYYKENSKIRFDLFAEINQNQWIGELNGTFTFSGDTLYVKRDVLEYTKIYVKRELPKECLNYKVDWLKK